MYEKEDNTMYEVRDIYGHTHKTTDCHDEAIGWYCWMTREWGYAEVWHNGECLLKPR